MTFSKYQQQIAPGTYLQTVLGALVEDPQPRFAMLPIGPMAEDMNKGIDQGLLRQLAQAAELGTATRAQLFVSPAGALSQLHYDQYDNLFFQVCILCLAAMTAHCSSLLDTVSFCRIDLYVY